MVLELPEAYQAEARAKFDDIETILGDATSLNDLTDDKRAEYETLKEEMRAIVDEVWGSL